MWNAQLPRILLVGIRGSSGCTIWVWELVVSRRYALITLCAGFVDEWLQGVMGGKDMFASIALL